MYILQSPKDVALAALLHKTSPVPLKIVIPNFHAIDKYGWKKRKSIIPSFPDQEIQDVRNTVKKDLIVSQTESDFEKTWSNMDVCLSRGREFVVLKPKAKKNVALSLTGSYFSRLYSILPLYDNLKICFFSEAWTDSKYLLKLGNHDLPGIEKSRKRFLYADIYGYYRDYLCTHEKDNIKKQLGLPLNQKIAFLSFRMAAPIESLYVNGNEFILSVKSMIKKFKDEGYYIVSRRRLGRHDLTYYNVMKSPEITRFNEIESMIDKEMNGVGDFPYDIWKGLYCSDILLLADISGICYIESAISRCPIYMPYTKEKISKISNFLLPSVKDMFDQNLIFNECNEENIKNYHQNIEIFLKKWYNYNVDEFWDKILS